jgi:hypothetical protein
MPTRGSGTPDAARGDDQDSARRRLCTARTSETATEAASVPVALLLRGPSHCLVPHLEQNMDLSGIASQHAMQYFLHSAAVFNSGIRGGEATLTGTGAAYGEAAAKCVPSMRRAGHDTMAESMVAVDDSFRSRCPTLCLATSCVHRTEHWRWKVILQGPAFHAGFR